MPAIYYWPFISATKLSQQYSRYICYDDDDDDDFIDKQNEAYGLSWESSRGRLPLR